MLGIVLNVSTNVSGQPTTSCLKFQGMSASVSGQAATSGLKFHGIRASIS